MPFGVWAAVGISVIVVVYVIYREYRRWKFNRTSEGIAVVQKQEDEAEVQRAASLKQNRQEERAKEIWADAHPRLVSLYKGLGNAALAGMLWIGFEATKDWLSIALFLGAAGFGLAALFNFLGAIFTPQGAGKLLLWVLGGGGLLWLANSALESTKGTILVGFCILIWIVVVGIEEIKKEIRKRDR